MFYMTYYLKQAANNAESLEKDLSPFRVDGMAGKISYIVNYTCNNNIKC